MTIVNLFGEESDPAVEGFEEFWRTYPRRVGKGAALKAFQRAVRRSAPGVIIAAAAKYRDDPERKSKEIQFTPHPATWLNQERWKDEATPVAARKTDPGYARIPAPRKTCGECDAGFIFKDDGSVVRCPCQMIDL